MLLGRPSSPGSFRPVPKGRSWIIEPKGDGWVFERTFPTKWKALMALRVYQDGGRPSDYFIAARERRGEASPVRDKGRNPKTSEPTKRVPTPASFEWRTEAAWMAEMALADCRKLPGCLDLLALKQRGWWTPDEMWVHIGTCQSCLGRSAVITEAAIELATMSIPGCDWLERQFQPGAEPDERSLQDHEKGCSICQSRWELVRQAAHVIYLSDWMPGCDWVQAQLAEAALNIQTFQSHLDGCAACRTRMQYLE